MANNLVENQIKNFFSPNLIKSRELLSSAFGMNCEKITLKNKQKYILKYYIYKKEKFNSIKSESKSLIYISNKFPGLCPKIYYNSNELLIMEFIEHNNIKKNDYQIILAKEIIKLHSITNNKYGLSFDSQIGGLKQPNKFDSNWINFFLNQRLNMIYEKINKVNPMPKLINNRIELLMDNINDFLPNNPRISLLHGDLWEGNILFNNGILASLIDPGIYYGHNELEIAYLTWFKLVDNQFLNYYTNFIPIDKYFNKYEPVYQLYFSLLNVYLWDRDYYLKDTGNLLDKIFYK